MRFPRVTCLNRRRERKSVYLDVVAQILLRDFKLIMEGELKEIVEDGGGHMVQEDEAL